MKQFVLGVVIGVTVASAVATALVLFLRFCEAIGSTTSEE